MNKILLVGGSGYIGTVVTDHLLSNGYQVRSLDTFLYRNNHCVLPYLGRDGYESMYGDLSSKDTLDQALAGVDSVLLLAGLVGDPITKKYPEESRIINELGVLQVINQIHGKGIERLIFVSTCSNYGLITDEQLADENFPLKPLSLYAKAKVAAEQYILSLRDKADYSPTILRFATAFGLSPRMRFDLTVSEFTRELATGKELLVFDAHTWRPYCHVRDFARLIQKVLEIPNELVANQVFNAGGDVNNFTKKMIVDEILNHVPGAKVRYQEHGADPRNYRVNFQKVRQVLDFEPAYTVRDGVVELLQAINGHVFDEVDQQRNLYGNYEINYPA